MGANQSITQKISNTFSTENSRKRSHSQSEDGHIDDTQNKKLKSEEKEEAIPTSDREDGEISEPEDAKPSTKVILQQRLEALKNEMQQQASRDSTPPVQSAPAVRYHYHTPLPAVPFTDYDVHLVRNGLMNGLGYDFLLSQGVARNLLDYAQSLIPSTSTALPVVRPSPTNVNVYPIPTSPTVTQVKPRKPKKGINLEIYNQNEELFKRDPKSLTKAERKERKKIAKMHKKHLKDDAEEVEREVSPKKPANSADDFLNSLSLGQNETFNGGSATSASLVEPPSQTFKVSQKPHLKRHQRLSPFLKAKSSEVIIVPSDEEEESNSDIESVSIGSAREVEQIPDWVIGKTIPKPSIVSSNSNATLSLKAKAAQGDVQAQNELKRKQQEISEMQLKIKQMELKREKQKLEALLMERQKSDNNGAGVAAAKKAVEEKKELVEEEKEKVEGEKRNGDVKEKQTDERSSDNLNGKAVEEAATAEVTGSDIGVASVDATHDNAPHSSAPPAGHTDAAQTSDDTTGQKDDMLLGSTLQAEEPSDGGKTNNDYESVFEKNPSLLLYVDGFNDEKLKSQLSEQTEMFTNRRLCKYELPLGGKCKDRE